MAFVFLLTHIVISAASGVALLTTAFPIMNPATREMATEARFMLRSIQNGAIPFDKE
jgi:hypothetical protein